MDRSRIRSLVLARRRVQLVRWADTPQHRQWLVWIAMSASMWRLAVRQYVTPALLASIKILRAKATARCAWRDRGPTRALLLVRAHVPRVRPARTPVRRMWHYALYAVRARSPTAAPALARRYVRNVSRGSTQRHQMRRQARSVRQGSTSARRDLLIAILVRRARPAVA